VGVLVVVVEDMVVTVDPLMAVVTSTEDPFAVCTAVEFDVTRSEADWVAGEFHEQGGNVKN
jgi:hypothetical protein